MFGNMFFIHEQYNRHSVSPEITTHDSFSHYEGGSSSLLIFTFVVFHQILEHYKKRLSLKESISGDTL